MRIYATMVVGHSTTLHWTVMILNAHTLSLSILTIIIVSSKAKAGGCGAIEVILNATITHKGNPDICEQGCKALQNILVNPAGQNSKK